MLSDLGSDWESGDLIYVTSSMLQVGYRFSRFRLISVFFLLSLLPSMIQGWVEGRLSILTNQIPVCPKPNIHPYTPAGFVSLC